MATLMHFYSLLLLLLTNQGILHGYGQSRPFSSVIPSGYLNKGLAVSAVHEVSAFGHHFETGSCGAYCNGEPLDYSNGDGYECSGTFKYVCVFSGNYTQAALYSKCEGNFKYHEYHGDKFERMFFACEGSTFYYTDFRGYCPVTGAGVKKVSKHSCLGSLYFTSKKCDAEDKVSCADDESQLPEIWNSLEHDLGDSNTEEKSYKEQKKCFGVRKAERLSVVDVEDRVSLLQPMSIDNVEASVDATFEAFAHEDHHDHPVLPKDRKMAHEGGHEGCDGGRHHHCNLTCNGGKAWLHGLLPCPGHLGLHCRFGHEDKDTKGDNKTQSRSAPMMDTFSPLLAPTNLQHGGNVSLTAACKGLWTGALGHACLGLTDVQFAYVGSEVDVDAWEVCTGFHTIFVHHHEKAAFMASKCLKQFSAGKEVDY